MPMPASINWSGRPLTCSHSPVANPHMFALTMLDERKIGHPNTGPKLPSPATALPYSSTLPNQHTAIVSAENQ